MSKQLLIYAPSVSPRLKYTFRLLFGHLLPLEFRLTESLAQYRHYGGPCLNYSPQPERDRECWLPAGPLLWETGIRRQETEIFVHEGLPAFFRQSAPGALLPFDLPALLFYLASRYEEYLPFEAGHYGRFTAGASLAARYGFLQQPLGNQWALRLGQLLQQRFPSLQPALPAYRFVPTFDVDLPWAYLHRPGWRLAAASLRDLLAGKWRALGERLSVLMGRREDPFFTFRYLQGLHEAHGLSPLFFFLLGDPGGYDQNPPPSLPAYRQLIASLSRHFRLGVHPSFRTDTVPGQILEEASRFKEATGQHPRRSRQHFLLLRFPDTYRRLVETGIHEDYSMGYAENTGFRASICTPFPWYSLQEEAEQPLMIFPFVAMDVTLKQYLELSPEQALEHLKGLCDAVREVGGDFTTLWHNSSFSENHGWGGWQEVYEKIVSYAR